MQLKILRYHDQLRGIVVRDSDCWSWGPGLIPGSAMGFFLEGDDSHGGHGLSSLVELRFKAPPGTPYSYITIYLIGTT
jgi:hypothetical protein